MEAGLNPSPFFVGIAPGEKGTGVVFIIKIEDKYFFMYKRQAGAKWWTLRCGKFHPPTRCSYSIRIRNINNLSWMGYEMFFEAAFKIGRIRPSKQGKDFARACEDFSHPENRVYFPYHIYGPYANIEYDYIV